MSKNISEEEFLLRKRARRRLVGAIVLVVFSVIVLPIIFDEPKPENEQHEIAINLPTFSKNNESNAALPQKEELKRLETFNKIDLPADLQDKPETYQQIIEENTEILGERSRIPLPGIKPRVDRKYLAETKNVNTITTNATNNAAVAMDTSKNATAAADTSKGFVIQLGAFSDQLKAKQQVENLISNGLKAYTETFRTGDAEITRVRIGPFTARNAAESELKKLKKLGFDGVITPR
ncbi:SPOR domain-containing protein [Nitrosomonas sp. Nm166]|uniref:SPOR domain-containing protein n=1 Tax=Nitrosomonas sp. Nm166 TaxID=1881054 RepID=UPI0008F12CC9|nr:SPOR domain-containing protein [Nitrosomonas sp. Nm166]SFF06273.1 DedD protein [Nitrosomonas sp. Nm166]